jgi:uncharacterized membrane protein YozB (DUF420 family)
MQNDFPAPAAKLAVARQRRTEPLRWYYAGLSGLLLLIVVLGFSRTFFLRSVFTPQPLPAYLYVHGFALTAWFSLVFAQSCLVAARRTDLHRRLGIVGAVNALVLVPLSGYVVIRAIPRYNAAGVDPAEIQFIVIGDLISIVVFSLLVGAALAWRRKREWHKRLMMVASTLIVGPAAARLERLGFTVPVPVVLIGLLIAVGCYDAARLGRLHRATIISSLAVLLSLGALLLVVGTPAGRMAVERLSRW